MLGIVLIFFYGEFLFLLKMGHLKKKTRRYIRYFYITLVTVIIAGGVMKRKWQYIRP